MRFASLERRAARKRARQSAGRRATGRGGARAPRELESAHFDGSGPSFERGRTDLERSLAAAEARGGEDLPARIQGLAGSRFEADLASVRVHRGPDAHDLSARLGARAFTTGRDIFFGQSQFEPGTKAGQRLIFHELAHVAQQTNGAARAGGGTVVQRQAVTPDLQDPRPTPPPNAVHCAPPADCPKSFCEPYTDLKLAYDQKIKMTPFLLAGIAAKVSSRVVPVWAKHLAGGSGVQNYSSEFGVDFTQSLTTTDANIHLSKAIKRSLKATAPAFPAGKDEVTVSLASLAGTAIAELDDPSGTNQMNFDYIGEIPGNLAGGIGKDQASCPAGENPSSQIDSRSATGTVTITRDAAGNLTARPNITYTVKDTVDLCPGNCGTGLEQLATVPLSQFEATGIAGDVPFTVNFPGNAGAFTIPTAAPGTPTLGTPAPATPAPTTPTLGIPVPATPAPATPALGTP